MDTTQYAALLDAIQQLSVSQLRHLGVRVNQQLSLDEVNQAIEKRAEKLSCCIHCHANNVVRWGHSHGLQRFRCNSCGKTFNELTKTPLARMRQRHKLAMYAQAMIDGLTLRKAAKRCGITLSTSFRWRHKLLSMPERHKAKILTGIVEVDETFFRESFKGKRTIEGREPRKRGRRRKGEPLIPVLIMLDRSEHEADFVLSRNSIEEVHPCLANRIKPDSVLCTDGSDLYPSFAADKKLCHKQIMTSNPARTVDDVFHIQTLNSYTAKLKGWMERFYGVGTAYLANYLAWWRNIAFEELESPRQWLNEALSE